MTTGTDRLAKYLTQLRAAPRRSPPPSASAESGRALRAVVRVLRRHRRAVRQCRAELESCRRDVGRLYAALLSRAVTAPDRPGARGETHAGGRPPAAEPPPKERPRHSEGFRSVRWSGVLYTLTPTQAAIVKLLWKAWENGTPEVGQDTLLRLAGSECNGKIASLFQESKSWGALIVPGSRKGSFRLADPPGPQGE